jgi:hypothetical protein
MEEPFTTFIQMQSIGILKLKNSVQAEQCSRGSRTEKSSCQNFSQHLVPERRDANDEKARMYLWEMAKRQVNTMTEDPGRGKEEANGSVTARNARTTSCGPSG